MWHIATHCRLMGESDDVKPHGVVEGKAPTLAVNQLSQEQLGSSPSDPIAVSKVIPFTPPPMMIDPETNIAVRACHEYLAGRVEPGFAKIYRETCERVHPGHAERRYECFLCELEHRKTAGQREWVGEGVNRKARRAAKKRKDKL